MNTFSGSALVLALGVALASPASAANFYCPPQSIGHVGQAGGGELMVSTSFGTFSLCSISFTLGGVTPDACKGWYSQALTARGLGKQMRFYFDSTHPSNANMVPTDPNDLSTNCTLANFDWKTRVPYHVELLP